MGVLSPEKQAELLKDKGNLCFKKKRLGAAIEAYTEAITLCPSVPTYWTNRALCERQRHEWDRVEADCWKALELDKNSVKAHYMLGLALFHSQQCEEAVQQLRRALDLAEREHLGSKMVTEIWDELAKVRYSEWLERANARNLKYEELRNVCESLLKEDYQKRFRQITQRSSTVYPPRLPDVPTNRVFQEDVTDREDAACPASDVSASTEVGLPNDSVAPSSSIISAADAIKQNINESYGERKPSGFDPLRIRGKQATQLIRNDTDPLNDYSVFKAFKKLIKMQQLEAAQEILQISEQYDRRKEILADVFDNLEDKDRADELPDHLCCRITMELYRDPVITSSGVTYERSAILEHLEKVGGFDPVTRKPLTAEHIIPNLAVKASVESFLTRNPWAYQS